MPEKHQYEINDVKFCMKNVFTWENVHKFNVVRKKFERSLKEV